MLPSVTPLMPTSVLLLVACTTGETGGTPGAPPAPPRPDILLVTLDTTRWDRVDLEAPTHTPTLAGLAAEGVRFPRAWAPVPLTLPSHASLLTGTDPLFHGARNNGRYVVPEDVPALAEVLGEAGYHTAAVVAAFPVMRDSGLARGFDLYDDALSGWTDALGHYHPERTATQVTDAALEAAAELPSPRFLWVHYFDPHRPWLAPPPFAAEAADPYEAEIAYADAELGRLIADLPQGTGERLTVVTADHGEGLADLGESAHGEVAHGLFVHDATTRVPLVMSWWPLAAAAFSMAARMA